MSRQRSLFLVLVWIVAAVACGRAADPEIGRSLAGITEERVRAHVEALVAIGPRPARDRDATGKALAHIEGRLRQFGYEVESETFDAGSASEQRNLFAVRKGAVHPDRIVEVGAHYDSVRVAPGADDNASGVAGVLEIARVVADEDFEKTIRLCFFAMEENGLVGSRHHVEQIQSRGESVEGIVVLEMIGYASDRPNSQSTPVRIPLIFSPPITGDFILVVGNWRSGGIGNRFESAARRYVPELDYFSMNRIGGLFRDAVRSDHYPYWVAGLRGVMITDTANFRNPNYHRATDTLDTLDFRFLSRVTRAAAATVMEWAVPRR